MVGRNGRLRPRSAGRRRVGLALVGVLTLSLTFALGILVGREWGRTRPVTAQAEPAKRSGTPARRALSEVGTERAPQIQEKLTFYQTLPAPLASPPPPSKSEAKPREEAAKERAKAQPDAAAPQYTVQVAAYQSKPAADDAERTLKNAGWEAYVVPVGGGDGRTTYRVRVGNFATRAEAEQAAERLRSERGLAPFVTTP